MKQAYPILLSLDRLRIPKNPKLQKIMVRTDVDMLVAAKNFSLSKCPINPVSTKPTRGMAKFAKNIGRDNLNI